MKPVILYSSAEQLPYTFDVTTWDMKRVKLDTGDYMLEGNNDICIERKSLDDYVRSISTDKERFFREVERLKEFKIRYIIVEGNLTHILEGKHSSNLSSTDIVDKTFSISIDHGVEVKLFESRQIAVYFLDKLFKYVLNSTHGKKTVKKRQSSKTRKPKSTKDIL